MTPAKTTPVEGEVKWRYVNISLKPICNAASVLSVTLFFDIGREILAYFAHFQGF